MTRYVVVFCVGFSALAVWFDWHSFRIPNRLILFGYFMAFLLQMLWLDGTVIWKLFYFVSGGFCPIFLMGLVWIAGGIGAGDVKLLSVLGAILGTKEIVLCCFMALAAGTVIGIAAKIIKRKKFHFSIAILVSILIYFFQNGAIF